ncbi:uncharacterized protein WCC33_013545 [Rhinophrynus dorsalis]
MSDVRVTQEQGHMSDMSVTQGKGHMSDMDALEHFLTEDEGNLSFDNISELEKFVQLLSDKVKADEEQLRKMKAEMQNLEIETAERSSKRDVYLSLMAQTVDLNEALSEEAKTQEELRAVSHELARLTEASEADSSEALGGHRLEKLEMDTSAAITSYQQKENQLLQEREDLKTSLQSAQAALAKAQQEEQRADEELLALQEESSSLIRCPLQSEADRLLDTCIKEIGLLRILPGKEHIRK